MACSRMPKWKFRPPGLSASKSPALGNLSVVLFEVPRSAEPPRNQGMFSASDAFWVWWKGRQVAIPARRQLTPLHLLDLGGELRKLLTIVGKECIPAPTRLSAARANAGIK